MSEKARFGPGRFVIVISIIHAFFFFIFKKIKISKIYVRFEIFQKYPR